MRGIEPRVSATRKQRDTDSLHPVFGIIADSEKKRLDFGFSRVLLQPGSNFLDIPFFIFYR